MSNNVQQMMDVDRYIDNVRRLGIEEAYRQRFRATGRTVREILKLATMMSEGKKVHVLYGNGPAQTHHCAKYVIKAAVLYLEDMGMQVERIAEDTYYFPQSGARVSACSVKDRGTRVEGWEAFELHAS